MEQVQRVVGLQQLMQVGAPGGARSDHAPSCTTMLFHRYSVAASMHDSAQASRTSGKNTS